MILLTMVTMMMCSITEVITEYGLGRKIVFVQDEIKDDLKHKTRGVLSMANSGPNSNGSQWFLTYAPQPSLDLK